MASRSSSLHLLATLVLFALLISPMFASNENPRPISHVEKEKQDNSGEASLPLKTDSIGQGTLSGLPTFEEDKHRHHHHHHHHHHHGYGSYGGYGGLGGGYGGYGGLRGGYGGLRGGGCMDRTSASCKCHCIGGRVATPQEVQASSKSANP